ncbi:histidinol-phosphate transaminase [soil metagenome]
MTTTSNRTFDLNRIVRPAVHAIHSYVPAKGAGQAPERVIRLDMNESPYPPTEHVRKALADFAHTNRYPSFDAIEVRSALAAYSGVPVESVVAGAGLDDVLNGLFQAILDPGDQIIISEPTFGVYRALADVYAAETVDVPLLPDFSLDPDAVLAAVTDRTKIIIICTPNNPTGNILDPVAVERIAQEAPCIVAIDEAYWEFAGQTHLDLYRKYENVAILRTMSKFAGMAGMRVGYGIYPEALYAAVYKVVPAFHNVSVASAVAVTAALEDIENLYANLNRIKVDREALADSLRELPGVHPYESNTNFLLIKLPVPNAGPVVKELANRGILVRHFANPAYGLIDCIRPSVGTTEENEILLGALAEILAEGASA